MIQKPFLINMASASLAMCWLMLAILLLSEKISQQTLSIAAITMLLSILVIWLQRRSLPGFKIKAIQQLAHGIEQRRADLLKPISMNNLPREIQPLIDALNHLLHREADQRQQEQAFSSETSHELRTPLAGIRLQTQVAQRTDNPEQRDKALSNVIEAIDRSTRLVEQLLTLSRLTHRRTGNERTSFQLETVCRKVINDYHERAEQRSINLRIDTPQTLPPVSAHNNQLEILLENLLNNALYYTPEKGEIRINLLLTANTVTLTVEDSGPGIPSIHHRQVLEPFQKAADGRKHGTGLGLAIAKRIAELHESQLILDRSSLGGLSVSLQLPLHY